MTPTPPKSQWHLLLGACCAAMLATAVLLAIFSSNLSLLSTHFGTGDRGSHDRIRATLRGDLMLQRGLAEALAGISMKNRGMFDSGIETLERGLGPLTDLPTPELNALSSDIARITQELGLAFRHTAEPGGHPDENLIGHAALRVEEIHLYLQNIDQHHWEGVLLEGQQVETRLHSARTRLTLLCALLVMLAGLLLWALISRRRAERYAASVHSQLEQRVMERTRELSRAGEHITEKSTLLKIILDALPTPLFHQNAAELLVDCNPAFLAWINRPEDEVLGKPVREILPAELHPSLGTTKFSRSETHREYELSSATGRPQRVLLHTAPIPTKPGGLVGVILDISYRRDNEEMLRKSREHYRDLLEGIPHGIAECNTSGIITFANRAFCRMFKRTPNALIDSHILQLVEFPEERQSLSDKFAQALAEQRPPSSEIIRNLTIHGEVLYRQVDWDYLKDIDGNPTGFILVLTDFTEHKKAEEALRTSEEKFRAGFNQTFQLCGLLSSQGKLLEVNHAALRIINEGPSAVIGRPFWETPWWAHSQEMVEIIEDAVTAAAAGEFVRFGYLQPTRDGKTLNIDFSLKPVRDGEGRITMLLAEGRDITEHKWAEQELRTACRTLETLVQASPLSILTLDPEHRVTKWNQAAEHTFGWSQRELLGRPLPNLAPPQDGGFGQALELLQAGRLLSGHEIRLQKKDGSLFDARISAAPLLGQGQEGAGVLCIIDDITENRRAKEALSASESNFRHLSRQFQTLLDGIPDVLTLLDSELKVVWGNRGAAAYFNRPIEALSQKTCYELWCNRDTPCNQCMARQCVETGEPGEQKISTTDGKIWGIKVFPIKDGKDQVLQVLHLATDITDKMRLREEAERYSRLASLGELSTGVAHEINNPNALILLNLSVISEAFDDVWPILRDHFQHQGEFSFGGLPFSRMQKEIPLMLTEMEDGARRIKRIVEDLKNFARQEPIDQFELFDLNRSVDSAIRLIQNQIRRATDHFEMHCAENLPPVRGVAQRIEQVIINLIANACQALDEKTQSIEVITRYDQTQQKVLLEVNDKGRGIDPQHLLHITDPFFTTRRKDGGTGLGLSVSARIVGEHRGDLHFESKPGKGTQVILSLPAFSEQEHRS